jgi:hypothetical protein
LLYLMHQFPNCVNRVLLVCLFFSFIFLFVCFLLLSSFSFVFNFSESLEEGKHTHFFCSSRWKRIHKEQRHTSMEIQACNPYSKICTKTQN